jgi:hypothetical protein
MRSIAFPDSLCLLLPEMFEILGVWGMAGFVVAIWGGCSSPMREDGLLGIGSAGGVPKALWAKLGVLHK